MSPPLPEDIPPEAPIFDPPQTGLRSHFTWRNVRKQLPLFGAALINPLIILINSLSKSQVLVDTIGILSIWGPCAFLTTYVRRRTPIFLSEG